MRDPRRRDLLLGAGALGAASLLACTGATTPTEQPAAPPPRPPKPGLPPPTMTGGTLFLPAEQPEGELPSRYVDRPDWFRRAPAIYLPTVVTAGASTMCFSEQDTWALPNRVGHFSEMPKFLDEAKKLGTNVLYIVDTFQGPDDWKKADWRQWKENYIPRDDLGGPTELRKAIDAIHSAGGKVIMYFSGYALRRESPLGQKRGPGWSVLDEQGEPITHPYPDYFMPCPNAPGWAEHLAEVSRRYAGDYGADGVHIDSYGNQRNFRCHATDHGHKVAKRSAFNDGCVRLAETVKQAMRKENPEAVTIVEAPKIEELFTTIDGAQEWGIHDLMERWCWNQAGNTTIYTAGWSLDDMHQIAATGHKWMLTPWWLNAPDAPGAVAWIDKHYPKLKKPKSEKMRRYEAERYYRGLHAYRNAGLLLGRAMPPLDHLTHRRWGGEEHFVSNEAFIKHIELLKVAAQGVDEALGSPGKLPSPAPHLKALNEARAARSAAIDDGAAVSLLSHVAEQAACYLMKHKGKKTITVVNVSNTEASVSVGAEALTLKDGVTSERLKGVTAVACAPHTVRLLQVV
jgi:hypothetical protein